MAACKARIFALSFWVFLCVMIASRGVHWVLMSRKNAGDGMNSDDAERKIIEAMADVKPHRLDSHTLKTKQLKFRLNDEEFNEIRETAEMLGLSISEYFCTLHRYARPRLISSSEAGSWFHPVGKSRRDSPRIPPK